MISRRVILHQGVSGINRPHGGLAGGRWGSWGVEGNESLTRLSQASGLFALNPPYHILTTQEETAHLFNVQLPPLNGELCEG